MWWLKNGMFHNLGMELDLFNPAPFGFVLPIPLIVVIVTFLSLRRTFASLDAVTIVEQAANPLSPWTFYLRHRRRGILILLGTSLTVLGIAFPVFLLSAMFSAIVPTFDYLQHVSMISPIHSELDPGIVSQVKGHPLVARTVPAVGLGMQMVMPPGGTTDVRIHGVTQADLAVLLDSFGLYVQEGRLLQPRSNEIVISAAIAANRDLAVGDLIGGESENGDRLIEDDMPTEMVVVGLLAPDRPWVGLASYEFLLSHELTSSRGSHLLILPQEDRKQALDSWLEASVDPTQTQIVTHGTEEREYREATTSLMLTFALLECMIAAVAAIALATLNHVFFTQRREEYGVLNAVGLSKPWLVLRTLKEAGSVVGIAWVAGAVLCGIGLICMQRLVYAPRGLPLDLFSPVPWLLTLPLPIAVLAASAGTIAWMLSRLNPVAIIERR
jgi:hypothetical protein